MARYSVIAVFKTLVIPEMLRDVIPYLPQEELLHNFTVGTLPDMNPGEIICEQLRRKILELLQKYQGNIIEIASVSHTLIG